MGVLEEIPVFYDEQSEKCARIGIDISPYAVSHVAVRCRTWRDYVAQRGLLEKYSSSNLENVWNGRPISKLLLTEPVPVANGQHVPMVELIPPFHQRVYRMGLEHLGLVVGADVDEFSIRHRAVLTGQQFQGPVNEPYYVLFPDYTHVKFYRQSLQDTVQQEGHAFDGFRHAEWAPADDLAGPYEVG